LLVDIIVFSSLKPILSGKNKILQFIIGYVLRNVALLARVIFLLQLVSAESTMKFLE